MLKKWDILGVGTCAVDDHYLVDQFPLPDEKIPVMSIDRYAGGQTATALVTAARHGARTAFFGCLGNDELSRFSRTEMEQEGVDCSLVHYQPGSRPYFAVVIVDASSSSRTILFSSTGVDEPDLGSFDPNWISASRLVFIDHNIPLGILHAARLAHEAGVPVVADIESTTISTLAQVLPLVDHLIVSRNFASRLTGHSLPEDMLSALSLPARMMTAVTLGSAGCWYQIPGQPLCHVPAFPVRVADTTGCGDIFHGAYAAAIARGESIHQAVIIATATAGMKAAQPGGRAGIPALDEVMRFLQQFNF
jgi:sulfofructose kinase